LIDEDVEVAAREGLYDMPPPKINQHFFDFLVYMERKIAKTVPIPYSRRSAIEIDNSQRRVLCFGRDM